MLLGAVLCKLIERLVGWARALRANMSSSSTTSLEAAASSTPLITSTLDETVSRETHVPERRVEVKVSIEDERKKEPEQGMRERRATPTPKPKMQPSSSGSSASASNEQQADRGYPVKELMIPEYGTKYHWDPDCPTLHGELEQGHEEHVSEVHTSLLPDGSRLHGGRAAPLF